MRDFEDYSGQIARNYACSVFSKNTLILSSGRCGTSGLILIKVFGIGLFKAFVFAAGFTTLAVSTAAVAPGVSDNLVRPCACVANSCTAEIICSEVASSFFDKAINLVKSGFCDGTMLGLR